MYMDVHFSPCLHFISARLLASVPSLFKSAGKGVCSTYFQKAYGKEFRTDRDVRGCKQKRCFCTAKTRVQKLTRMSIFELAMDGGDSSQK